MVHSLKPDQLHASNCACMVTFSSFKLVLCKSPSAQLLDQSFQLIKCNQKIKKNTFVFFFLFGLATLVCKQTKTVVNPLVVHCTITQIVMVHSLKPDQLHTSNCACMVTFSSFKLVLCKSPSTQLLDQTFKVIKCNQKIKKIPLSSSFCLD